MHLPHLTFFSGREKCIYALTGKPLFETKTGVLGRIHARIHSALISFLDYYFEHDCLCKFMVWGII